MSCIVNMHLGDQIALDHIYNPVCTVDDDAVSSRCLSQNGKAGGLTVHARDLQAAGEGNILSVNADSRVALNRRNGSLPGEG